MSCRNPELNVANNPYNPNFLAAWSPHFDWIAAVAQRRSDAEPGDGKTMKYDDASWHYGGDFPEGQPDEYGATHIALFLRWCLAKGFAGHFIREEVPEGASRVVSGELSATTFFMEFCDGKLVDDMLNNEGNAFASYYYGDDGAYLGDYADQFADLMYVAPESQHDFAKFTAMVDGRYHEFLKRDVANKKPWWKLW